MARCHACFHDTVRRTGQAPSGETCPVCLWVDDITPTTDGPFTPSAGNHDMNLREARANVDRHGVAHPSRRTEARPALEGEVVVEDISRELVLSLTAEEAVWHAERVVRTACIPDSLEVTSTVDDDGLDVWLMRVSLPSSGPDAGQMHERIDESLPEGLHAHRIGGTEPPDDA